MIKKLILGLIITFAGFIPVSNAGTPEQKYNQVIKEIKHRMHNRERWAHSESVGIGTKNLSNHYESGFNSARSFLLARDREYKLLNDILHIEKISADYEHKYEFLIYYMKSRMVKLEYWASGNAVGIGTNNFPVFAEMGFKTAHEFLLARNCEYRTLNELVNIGVAP